MKDFTYLEYVKELEGYDYYIGKSQIFRFELYLKKIQPSDIFAGKTKIRVVERSKSSLY